jgi:hypothetical protein
MNYQYIFIALTLLVGAALSVVVGIQISKQIDKNRDRDRVAAHINKAMQDLINHIECGSKRPPL